jgi:hypothetical protein
MYPPPRFRNKLLPGLGLFVNESRRNGCCRDGSAWEVSEEVALLGADPRPEARSIPPKPSHVTDPTSTEHIFKLRSKTLPFPQHLRDTTFVKRRANLHHRTSRDRDCGTGILWHRDDGLHELAVQAHGVVERHARSQTVPQ